MNIVKRLKFIFVGIFIFLTVAFCGEWYQYNFNVLPTYIIEFYADGNFDELKAEISDAAEKNDIIVAFIDRKIVSTNRMNIEVFADKEAEQYFIEDINLSPGIVRSLFSGETETEFYSFESFMPKSANKKVTLHLLGESEGLESFWYDLKDNYDISYPEKQSVRKVNIGLIYFGALALLTLLICFLMSYYEYSFAKKEYFVRMTLGENIGQHILKNIAADSFVYFFIWIMARLAVVVMGSQRLFEAEQICLISGVVIVNSAVYLLYLKLTVKQTVSSEVFVSTVSAIKVFSMILACLTVSLCLNQLKNNISYYSQKPFFEEYKDACWYNAVVVPDGKSEDEYMNAFYKKHYDDMSIYSAYEYISLPQSGESTFAVNGNAFNYLAEQSSELANIDMSLEKYILIKRDKKLSDADKNELRAWAKTEDAIVYYDKDIELIALMNNNYHSEPETKIVKNPVVVFENEGNNPTSFYTKWLITADKDVFKKFAEENDVTYSETNALDFFNESVKENNRLLYLYLILSILLLCVEFFNTVLYLKLKYAMQAVELAVKQTTGYSAYERFKNLYILCVSSWIAVFILICILFRESLIFSASAIVLILIFELLLIKFYIRKRDKLNIYTVLKGGIL